jgi:hypothetical protein
MGRKTKMTLDDVCRSMAKNVELRVVVLSGAGPLAGLLAGRLEAGNFEKALEMWEQTLNELRQAADDEGQWEELGYVVGQMDLLREILFEG